jgi:hypothetical protein
VTAARIRVAELLGARVRSQLIEGATAPGVVEAARHMFAMQAQDPAAAAWALGLRARGSRIADVAKAYDEGHLVRSWPMRGTLHVLPADELHWLLGVTAERAIAATATRRRQLELDDATVGRALELLGSALAGGRALGRAEALALFEGAGIATAGQRGYHLLWHAAQTGLVVWGPADEGQQRLVLLDEWVAAPRRLDGEEALGELLLRFLSGHGPATIPDFAKWADITLSSARTGLAVALPLLQELEVDGEAFWARADAEIGGRRASGAHALPGFEEYLLGYKVRDRFLDPDYADRVVPGGNGIFKPLVVVRGRIVGTWRQRDVRGLIEGAVQAFDPLTKAELDGFRRSLGRFARFQGKRLSPELSVTP